MAVVLILGVFYYYRTSHLLQINSTLTKEKQHSIIQRHAPPFGLHVHIGKIHKLLECSKVFLNWERCCLRLRWCAVTGRQQTDLWRSGFPGRRLTDWDLEHRQLKVSTENKASKMTELECVTTWTTVTISQIALKYFRWMISCAYGVNQRSSRD